ncbi:phosphatase PAP2 family protein [Pararhizobium haloflavum]|uniref:phosphatase PAP2 family protein n=1 Tax=Pararhizobium haloflavum TaxID=2037914 RepID=UPI0013000532|nr:phosphatase PAP2 family protein [Pararhizobium haloflavum]
MAAALVVLATSSYWFLADRHAVDRALLLGLADPSGSPEFEGAFVSVAWSFTALGSPEVVFVFAAAMTLFFALSSRWIETVHTVASIAGGAAAGYAAKAVTGLVRPHHAPGSSELLHTSFPSGHALLATLLFGTAAVLAARRCKRLHLQSYLVATAAGISLAVGVSRVYLGTHWPSDVLAGWSFGLIWILLVDAGRARLRVRPNSV